MNDFAIARPKRTVGRKLLIAFLVLISVSLVVVMPTLFWELHEANKALHGFCDALMTKQYRSAYSVTTKEFQTSLNFEEFTQTHDALVTRMGDLKSVEITHSEIKKQGDGWLGTAEANMNFARGNLSFIYTLKNNDGTWKVYNYREE